MPLYEYHCDACNQNFEKLQRFSDETLTVHEECPSTGSPVHRLISVSALQFKGSGFYITDYKKSNSSSPSSESGSSDKASGGSTESTKSESKPAATPAPAASPSTGTDSK